ncbi:acyl-homoserine lactone acylase PvdQ [Mucilaginibacter frigoritolerans]|uniref:Acyl-homoserine lactone acylase PvdQ n=1 Tax=Mucilaginibacter frigoritolerans TaxID=652788 RepID=A0A562U7Z7_9SPHI|nr:penicillin acylase family protein [Mucilaginibacter frigoritolerans]TWJ01527.1 acyl-homoserine lactone acylase PvdQ [Mucilaginibacter frigoritolerans]
MTNKLFLAFFLLPFFSFSQKYATTETSRFEQEARSVTIIRDNWGVPHIYGKTDAAVVFGLMYTQCEDNFKGIEQNYLYQLGKQTEAAGEKNLYTDVQLQLIADTTDAIKDYKASPLWFRKLMDAFADGINYYLYKHPEVKPLVFQHFEPWFALMFTDGSVSATVTGGISLNETSKFYGAEPETLGAVYKSDNIDEREIGSNGFAIAPARSASGNAMLYINPHVPFYFRSEVQLVSDEGLNVYGAVTWGQFFVYQGFNQHCGWMHTSSNADVGDLYAEKVTKKDGQWFYEYNGQLKPVSTRKLILKIRKGDQFEQKEITGYFTHHGPILGSRDGKWLALKANNRSYNALLESWLITKANTFAEYKKAMGLLSNATNNTVYADDRGNIAFWYGNFMPNRDAKLDWTLPVDGSTPATEWRGLHSLDEIVHVYNPATGWIENCNSTPFTSSGISSPDKTQYPAYMAPDGQNFRAVNAIKLLDNNQKLSIDELISKGYDHYLTAFDVLLPPLFNAYNTAEDSIRQKLAEPIKVLQQWDRNTAANSVASTLAVEWGTLMLRELPAAKTAEAGTYQTERVNIMLKNISNKQILELFGKALSNLQQLYGNWQINWGDINRYQRPANGISFNDSLPSLPVGLTSSAFGQLPSFVSRTMNTKKRYGYSGNSFIAAVEFGSRIKAKTVITGGQSFDPASKNFTDQAGIYIEGKFKDVLFYKEDVLKHAEKTYHPGY